MTSSIPSPVLTFIFVIFSFYGSQRMNGEKWWCKFLSEVLINWWMLANPHKCRFHWYISRLWVYFPTIFLLPYFWHCLSSIFFSNFCRVLRNTRHEFCKMWLKVVKSTRNNLWRLFNLSKLFFTFEWTFSYVIMWAGSFLLNHIYFRLENVYSFLRIELYLM